MASFKLNLKALPFESQSVNYRLEADFFEGDEPTEVIAADVEVEVTVDRTSECDYRLSISCQGTMEIPCDCCLEPMVHQVETMYPISIRQEGDVLDDSRDGLLLVPETWRELDIAPLIRDTVLLTIPIMHTHAPGECNAEMLAHLAGDDDGITGGTGEASGEAESTDPRWDALRKLKNNN